MEKGIYDPSFDLPSLLFTLCECEIGEEIPLRFEEEGKEEKAESIPSKRRVSFNHSA